MSAKTLVVEFPLDLVSAANFHGRRRVAIGRVKRHREAGRVNLLAESRRVGLAPRLPCTITITRFGSKKLDGHENLAMACKALVDGIACKPTRLRPAGFFEVDDGDERFTWIYRQQIVPKASLGPLPGVVRVRIEIEWQEGDP
jgi:hypothetical protein